MNAPRARSARQASTAMMLIRARLRLWHAPRQQGKYQPAAGKQCASLAKQASIVSQPQLLITRRLSLHRMRRRSFQPVAQKMACIKCGIGKHRDMPSQLPGRTRGLRHVRGDLADDEGKRRKQNQRVPQAGGSPTMALLRQTVNAPRALKSQWATRHA